MRIDASQFVLAAVVGLFAPACHAATARSTPHKAAVVAESHKPASKADKHAARAVPVKAQTKTKSHGASGKASTKASARKQPVAAHATGGHKSAKPEPRVTESHKAAPIVRAQAEPVAEPPAAPLPEIHVTHDRKQHHAAETPTEDQTAEIAPRKATSADFLKPFADEDQAASAPEPKPHAIAEKPVAAKPVAAKPVATIHASAPPVLPVAPPAAATPKAKIETQAAKASAAKVATVLVAPEPMVAVKLEYNRHGKVIMPPALKGSHEILVRQNEVADRDGVGRVEDDDDLDGMRERKQLVPIPVLAGLQSDERLPSNRRYCRPWTAQFLAALARAHYAKFHTALQVNSAVRTVEVQERLLRTNGNAAGIEGETASPHLTGQAVDLAKHGLSLTEIAWLRGYLLPLVQAGKVDVEEEFQQACFHISVYKKYVPQAAPKREIAAKHGATTALATAIR